MADNVLGPARGTRDHFPWPSPGQAINNADRAALLTVFSGCNEAATSVTAALERGMIPWKLRSCPAGQSAESTVSVRVMSCDFGRSRAIVRDMGFQPAPPSPDGETP